MKKGTIARFVVLGVLWLGLCCYMLAHAQVTLYTVIVASAIIIFVPMYKKYIKK